MKNFALLILFVFGCNAYAQDELSLYEINNYKYIIIPEKFDFLNRPDQYDVNSLAKFLFNKYGYKTYFENEELPLDYLNNNCLGLTAKVEKVKGGFLTKGLQINLADCKNKIIVQSKIGKSKEKEFKKAYNLALREAFKMFQYFNHEYTPNPEIIAQQSSSTEKEITSEPLDQQKKIEELELEVAILKKKTEVDNGNSIKLDVETDSKADAKLETKTEVDSNILYAQPIKNGFQVVDSTPKVIMILLETPKDNIFIVKDQNAIVYKEDGFWYFSRNDGSTKALETLNIKF